MTEFISDEMEMKNFSWSCDNLPRGAISTMIASSPEYWFEFEFIDDGGHFKPEITLPIVGNEYAFFCKSYGFDVLCKSLAELHRLGETRLFFRKDMFRDMSRDMYVLHVCTEHELATIADRCRAVAKSLGYDQFVIDPRNYESTNHKEK